MTANETMASTAPDANIVAFKFLNPFPILTDLLLRYAANRCEPPFPRPVPLDIRAFCSRNLASLKCHLILEV